MLDTANLVLTTGPRTTKNINSHHQQHSGGTAGAKKSIANSLTSRLQNSACLLTQQSSVSTDSTTVLGKRPNNGVLRHAVTGTVGVLPSGRGLSKRLSTAGDVSRTNRNNQRRPSGMQSS